MYLRHADMRRTCEFSQPLSYPFLVIATWCGKAANTNVFMYLLQYMQTAIDLC